MLELLTGLVLGLTTMGGLWYYKTLRSHRSVNVVQLDDWAALSTGESGDLEKEYAWLRKVQFLFKLFCRKQKAYGPTPISVNGPSGLGYRLVEKTARIYTLQGLDPTIPSDQKPKIEVGDERISDTWADIAVMGIIASLVCEGSWPLMSLSEALHVKDKGLEA